MGLILIEFSNVAATESLCPASGYKWKVKYILAQVTGTSTADSSLTVGIPGIDVLTLLSISSTSTSTTVSGQAGPVSGTAAGANVGFTGEIETTSDEGLYLEVINNGTVEVRILVDEVPA